MILSTDTETYSAVDIGACGSFRYVDDPSFELLLLAYAFDDGPVNVVDVASGESVPQEVIDALYDPAVTKTAWNCAFERAVYAKVFGRDCPPDQLEDSMILAAVCGLPMNLAGASVAL